MGKKGNLIKRNSFSYKINDDQKLYSNIKKILGDNVGGTLDLMKEEEVDEEAFLDLDSSHLKEMD